jgi:hypothetical protein
VIADSGHDRIRKVSPSGRITTIAGTTAGFAGDGGPATSAKLDDPRDVIALHDGSFLVADTGNDRVRRIAPDGTISTLAGSQGGFRGDGGDATHARLNRPRGLAIEPSGDVLVVDQGNHRVRRISHGTIETVAGGASGFGGDLGLATSAQFDSPTAVMPLTNGGFLVADGANDRIRRVTPLGVVFTIVGSDSGLSGDGGPASQARIDAPAAIVPTGDGGFFIADAGNNRVRRVTDTGQLPAPSARRLIGVSPVNGDVRVLPQGGKRYVTLREADVTPNASFVDAKPGRIAVTADQGGGTLKTMNFYEGAFRMTQGKGAKPVTDIRLSDPLDGCLSAKRLQPGKATIAAKKRRSRHVWGNGHGRYRTKGRYASALVRGTIWRTTDVCSSTTVRVARGLVQVRDLVKKRTVFVKAGRSYTARAAKRG